MLIFHYYDDEKSIHPYYSNCVAQIVVASSAGTNTSRHHRISIDSRFDMENDPVTIIVKAPNQQFEDQTIKCEITWTIERLKSYLSEVYPNKPVSCQIALSP